MALDDLDADRADINYLFHLFKVRGFEDVTTGSSQPQIIQQNLRKVQIPLPSLDSQIHIARRLNKIHEQIVKCSEWSKDASRLYAEAGHRLFSS
jgi:type I restriction enzyme S subunit